VVAEEVAAAEGRRVISPVLTLGRLAATG
jgi:hypothetical protein